MKKDKYTIHSTHKTSLFNHIDIFGIGYKFQINGKDNLKGIFHLTGFSYISKYVITRDCDDSDIKDVYKSISGFLNSIELFFKFNRTFSSSIELFGVQ